MHVKSVKTKGNCAAAVAYVLRLDGKKHPSGEQITVLRGNGQTTSDLGMSLDFKYTYTSSVIAWHGDDNPTKAQINEVLDDWEKLALAGLDQQNYNFLAVQHTEADGSKHIHIITPRVELSSGRSLNIAPPGHIHDFDALRDYHNKKHGWKSPDIIAHPENARTLQLGLNRGNRKELMKSIDIYVTELIKTGHIQDRASLCEQLEEAGLIVTKKENKHILVLDPTDKKMKKGMRLKGEIYEQNFTVGGLAAGQSRREAGRSDRTAQPNLDELQASLAKASKKRADYHSKRYPQALPASHEIIGMDDPINDNNRDGLLDKLPAHNGADMANNPRENDRPAGLQTGDLQQSNSAARMQPKRLATSPKRGRKGNRLSPAQLEAQTQAILRLIEALARLFGANISLTNQKKGGQKHDRNREQISSIIATAKRANERAKSSHELAQHNIERASAELEQRSRGGEEIRSLFNEAAQNFKRTNELVEQLKLKQEQEQSNGYNNFEWNN